MPSGVINIIISMVFVDIPAKVIEEFSLQQWRTHMHFSVGQGNINSNMFIMSSTMEQITCPGYGYTDSTSKVVSNSMCYYFKQCSEL